MYGPLVRLDERPGGVIKAVTDLALPAAILTALVAVIVVAMLAMATPAQAATFTVTKTADTNGGCTPDDCSLREAIMAANAGSSGTDTITVPSGQYTLTLRGAGDLDVLNDVKIVGAGADKTTVSAASLGYRVFDVRFAEVKIADLKVSRGEADIGAGIKNLGKLTLDGSIVTENQANFDGGGINNDGILMLTNKSTVIRNSARLFGGGISNTGGTMKTMDSTVSGNQTSYCGGGISTTGGALTIIDSTVSGNSASYCGGGINSDTNQSGRIKTTIENSTISGNFAARTGGGVYNNDGQTTIRYTTITANRASEGAGVASYGGTNTSTVVDSSIIAANPDTSPSSGRDVDFIGNTNTFDSQGYNVIGDGNAKKAFDQPGDKTGVSNPGLDPLEDNGGPTKTRALLSGSPAVDAIPQGTNGCGTTITTDQRGVSRPQGNRCDIGAFEKRSTEGQ